MGHEFWSKLRDFIQHTMIAEGTISPRDTRLVQPAETVDEAIRTIREELGAAESLGTPEGAIERRSADQES